MNDSYTWWLFFVGLAVGIAGTWLVLGRVRRNEDDIAGDERSLEANWIGDTIRHWGGEVPVELVDQILELHRRYTLNEAPLLAPLEPIGGAPAAAGSGGDTPPVEGDGARRETPEAHVGQPG
jgi:hypothetical protein